MNQPASDVAIMGGGLAGLSLAIQLKQRDATTTVTVVERRRHPVREAAFKVGESTVEIGAHYFADVLGLREHLDSQQLRKFGFRFFFSEGRSDIDRCTELGVSKILPTPSWQLDRGRFENFLGEHARALGVRFYYGAAVVRQSLSILEYLDDTWPQTPLLPTTAAARTSGCGSASAAVSCSVWHPVRLDAAVTDVMGPGWSRADAARERAVTVRHLLAMSSGLDAALRQPPRRHSRPHSRRSARVCTRPARCPRPMSR